MATTWRKTYTSPNNVNGGNEYQDGDQVSTTGINVAINNVEVVKQTADGIASGYIKKITVSGNTMTATKQDDSTVTFNNTWRPTSDIVNLIYPVGSVYLSMNNVNPSTLFGGTWEAYGSSDTYLRLGGNSYGGSNVYNLTSENIPYHTHSYSEADSTTGGTKLSIYEVPSHSHSYRILNSSGTAGITNIYGASNSNFKTGGIFATSYVSNAQTGRLYSSQADLIGSSGGQSDGTTQAHTHSVSKTSSSTGSYGAKNPTAITIEPKYVQVYAWKRTA